MKNKNKISEGGSGTFVGNALRILAKTGITVAPAIIDMAAKAVGLGDLINLSDAIRGDKNITGDTEALLLAEVNRDMVEMQELTKRLQSDNEHVITRLIRPVSYAFMLLNLAILMYLDGNAGSFEIKPEYIPVIQYLIGIMTAFLFGSRGGEKIMKEVNKYKSRNGN